MANFLIAFYNVIGLEGGYSNDADDNGGETYNGISRKNWPGWMGWYIIDDLKNKPTFPHNVGGSKLMNLVMIFYEGNFWTVNRLTSFIDQNIANEIFDTSVNQGINKGVEYLQRALNLLNRNGKDYPDLKVDGKIGPETLKLVNTHPNPKLVFDLMNTLQGAKYIAICEADRTQERFMNGWLKRVYSQF